MFSVLRASLFRPLPFPRPEQLVLISRTQRQSGQRREMNVPYPIYEVLRDHTTAFESIAAYTTPNVNVAGYEQGERVDCEFASANYFHVLGASAALGRAFATGDDAAPGKAPVVVLSWTLWRRLFGGDSAIVGKSISVNRVPLTVLGVMPPAFGGLGGRAELWIPHTMAPVVAFPYQSFAVVARLREGPSLAQARPQISAIDAQIPREADNALQQGEWNLNATLLSRARVDSSNERGVLILFGAVC